MKLIWERLRELFCVLVPLLWILPCDAQCPAGFTKTLTNTACYKLVTSNVNHAAAEQACAAESGSWLPMFRSRQDIDDLRAVLPLTNTIHIGANDIAEEGVWVQENPDYCPPWVPWSGGEPNNANNEDCATLYTSGVANDLSCGAYGGLAVVCQVRLFDDGCDLCPTPTIQNGVVTVDPTATWRKPDVTAVVTCNTNSKLVGSADVTCVRTGSSAAEWQIMPACKRICANLASPENGATAHTQQPALDGSSATFSCNAGFYLVGQPSSMCTSAGSWNNPIPVCSKICPSLTLPNGGVQYTSNPVVKDVVATFSCNGGYYLDGSSTSQCEADGMWIDPVPQCKKNCPILSLPNGDITYGSEPELPQEDTIALFSCNSGYHLVGSDQSLCQAGGIWSIPVPVCYKICPSVSLENGAVSYSATPSIKDVRASFTCADHYYLIGASDSSCDSSGQWRKPIPECRAYCEMLSLDHGSVDVTNDPERLQQESIATFVCDDGYHLIGSGNSVCLSDSSWSNPIPACKKMCPAQLLRNGQISLSSEPAIGGVTSAYKCHERFTLKGNKNASCNGLGKWTSEPPFCKQECGMPNLDLGGKCWHTGMVVLTAALAVTASTIIFTLVYVSLERSP